MMMFTWRTHKIAIANILHFDKNSEGKKSNFLVKKQSENEFHEAITETNFLC